MEPYIKSITAIFTFSLLYSFSFGQTTQGGVLSQENSKEISEYYCKQFIVDEILKVPTGQPIRITIDVITAAKSGELATVLYECSTLQKAGLVFAFWNGLWNGISPYKGFGFYGFNFDDAKELLDSLEYLMNKGFTSPTSDSWNLVYKTKNLTFLFFDPNGYSESSDIRVWWQTFDSDWNQNNLRTTIRRFRKFFNLPK